MPETIDRSEFTFYDIMKTNCLIGMFLSTFVACTGCHGLKVTKTNAVDAVHKNLKCSIFKFVLVVLTWMFMAHTGRDGMAAYKDFQAKHGKTSFTQFEDMTASDNKEEFAAQIRSLVSKTADDNHCEKYDQKICHSAKECSWCSAEVMDGFCAETSKAN